GFLHTALLFIDSENHLKPTTFRVGEPSLSKLKFQQFSGHPPISLDSYSKILIGNANGNWKPRHNCAAKVYKVYSQTPSVGSRPYVFSVLAGAWRQIKSWLVDVEARQFAKKSWRLKGLWKLMDMDGWTSV